MMIRMSLYGETTEPLRFRWVIEHHELRRPYRDERIVTRVKTMDVLPRTWSVREPIRGPE